MKTRSKACRVLAILISAPIASTAFCCAFIDGARGDSGAKTLDFVIAGLLGLIAFLNFIALIRVDRLE